MRSQRFASGDGNVAPAVFFFVGQVGFPLLKFFFRRQPIQIHQFGAQGHPSRVLKLIEMINRPACRQLLGHLFPGVQVHQALCFQFASCLIGGLIQGLTKYVLPRRELMLEAALANVDQTLESQPSNQSRRARL